MKNRIKLLEHQLYLINLYKEDFIEKDGEAGVEERINGILDEYIEKSRALQKIEDEETSNSKDDDKT